MERNDVIAKVRKMLELAKKSTYDGESQAAYAMAQKFMMQHNLSELEIQGAAAEAGLKTTVTKEKVDSFTKGTNWKASVAWVIAQNFRCMAFQSHTTRDETTLMFLGTETDVAMATEVYNAAIWTITKGAKRFRAERREELRADGLYNGKEGSRAACLSWIDGFIRGMRDRFDEMKRQMMEENSKYALVIVLPQEVEEEAIRLGLKARPLTPEEQAARDAENAKWLAQYDADLKAGKIKPYKMKKQKAKASDRFDHEAYQKGIEKGKKFDGTIKPKLGEGE